MTYGFKSRHPHHVANLQSPYVERSLEVFFIRFPSEHRPGISGPVFFMQIPSSEASSRCRKTMEHDQNQSFTIHSQVFLICFKVVLLL